MSNNLPFVSIITPCFNAQHFIDESIESVLIQDYANFEHIPIYDGSQDRTVDILKQYPTLLCTSELDTGQSQAKLAKENWLYLLK